METIKAKSVTDETTVELNENQKNIAIDSELIHYDGKQWRFFSEDLPLLESLKKAH